MNGVVHTGFSSPDGNGNTDGQHPHQPAASVVTTVFNRASILGRAMRSVLDQSFSDFEYIIVDDGSTDGSADIAASFGDPRVRVLRSPHRGRAAALNTAFAACTGEFILIQDSDDVALPGRFEKQIAFLRENPEVGMVGCQLMIMDARTQRQRLHRLPLQHDEIARLMILTSAVPFCAAAIRRAILPSAAPFDESMPAAVDFAFQLDVMASTQFANLAEVLQQKIDYSDSLGQIRGITQRDMTLHRSRAYLQRSSLIPSIFPNTESVLIARARLEYYHGDLKIARSILFSILRTHPANLLVWRYFLPSLLGSSFLRALRGTSLIRSAISSVKRAPSLRRYFLPLL